MRSSDFTDDLADAIYRLVIDRRAGLHHVTTVGDVATLRDAFAAARGAGSPVAIVVEIAFDPREAIPPYSERPDEIRARFRL